MYQYDIQLLAAGTEKALSHGGAFYVVTAGTPSRITLYDNTDTVKNNPATISNGFVSFRTAESVNSVDIYGMTDKGYAFQILGVTPGALSAFKIDLNRLDQTIMIPFDIGAAPAAVLPALTAAAEFMSGFKLPSRMAIKPIGIGVLVTTLDATEDIDIGVNSTSGTDDPDGFTDALSLATATFARAEVGWQVATNNTVVDLTGGGGEWTLGALLHPAGTKVAKSEGADAAATDGNGIYFLTEHVAGVGSGATWEEITFTLSTGTDTAAGIIVIPARINSLPY